jgi:hypothetical protein
MAETAMSSERNVFWRPIRVLTFVLAVIGGAATLIANVGVITAAFEPSLSGAWVLTLDNKNSSLKTYQGMSSTYQLYLVQDDADHLTGTGEKIKVNGKDIPMGQHERLDLKGSVSGGLVAIDFIQKAGPDGAARQTNGELNLKILRAGRLSKHASRLEGSFSSTAASTSGTALAVPQPQ